jgi:anti-anti-sigma factor
VPGRDRSHTDFSVTARFVGEESVLSLNGEVDTVTAPEFEAFLETMIDRDHRSVILDLAGLRFMDASGLAVIARAASRLDVSGGTLTIRTPATMIQQMFDITGFARLIRSETDPSSEDYQPLEVVPSRMSEDLLKFTAIHSGDELVDGALRLAVTLARAAVGGADGVSVSLRRHGQLSTVAATDQTILDMDANQYETGEGPCVDASVEGRCLLTESLDTETRWPAFTPRARALGIKAILSSPLLVQDRPVGALNIYSHTPAAFTARDQELAAEFATESSLILGQAGLIVTDDQLSGRFQRALRTREVIAQAQGVLMERDGMAEHDAYSALRQFSRGSGRPLQERAEHVVFSTRRPRADLAPGAEGVGAAVAAAAAAGAVAAAGAGGANE